MHAVRRFLCNLIRQPKPLSRVRFSGEVAAAIGGLENLEQRVLLSATTPIFDQAAIDYLTNTNQTQAANIGVTFKPEATVTGDFNGDGLLDVAVGYNRVNGDTFVRVYTGGMGGTSGSVHEFDLGEAGPFATLNRITSLAAGDFDKDGLLDLAILSESKDVNGAQRSGDFMVLFGYESSGFWQGLEVQLIGPPQTATPVLYQTEFASNTLKAESIITEDFDGDGFLDIAVTTNKDEEIAFNRGHVNVYYGQADSGDGVLFAPRMVNGSPEIFTVEAGANGLVAGDFDGDGKLDLAVTNTLANNLTILFSEPAAGGGVTFSDRVGTPIAVGNAPVGITAADLDGDGFLDLAVANRDSDSISVLLAQTTVVGSQTVFDGFTSRSDYATGSYAPTDIQAGDFDKDGVIDLIVTHTQRLNSSGATLTGDAVTLMFGTGGGLFDTNVSQTFNVADSPTGLSVGDFNNDGLLDALVVRFENSLMTVLYNQLIAGDLNRDGFVGLTDLNIVLGNWNQNVTPGSWAAGDPSGDGFVGIADMNTVLDNWNAGTPV